MSDFDDSWKKGVAGFLNEPQRAPSLHDLFTEAREAVQTIRLLNQRTDKALYRAIAVMWAFYRECKRLPDGLAVYLQENRYAQSENNYLAVAKLVFGPPDSEDKSSARVQITKLAGCLRYFDQIFSSTPGDLLLAPPGIKHDDPHWRWVRNIAYGLPVDVVDVILAHGGFDATATYERLLRHRQARQENGSAPPPLAPIEAGRISAVKAAPPAERIVEARIPDLPTKAAPLAGPRPVLRPGDYLAVRRVKADGTNEIVDFQPTNGTPGYAMLLTDFDEVGRLRLVRVLDGKYGVTPELINFIRKESEVR